MDRFSSVFNGNLFVGVNCYQKDYLNTTGFIAELADKKSIPLVALNDVLFINKDDHLAHQAKVAINNSSLLKDDVENSNVTTEQYFKTFDEMKQIQDTRTWKRNKIFPGLLETGRLQFPTFPGSQIYI